ncbi:zinc finger protein 677-like [Macrobrachium rosenbergii]|uniref:zinc finger protein 677-like n=1 Tax=Macrobrachium rosenbergii TaxID=79674 RepID=UPI0034D676A5
MFHQSEYIVPETYLPDVMGRVPMERESVMGTHQRPLLSPLKAVRLVKKARKKAFPYVCHVAECGEKFFNSHGLDTHLKLHLGVKPFTCNLCGKVCQTESKLKAHQASHANDGVKPVCDICERSFSSRSSLNKHKKMLHKPKPHICPECQSGFEERRYMAIHAKQAHNLDIPLESSINNSFSCVANCSTDLKSVSSLDGSSKGCFKDNMDGNTSAQVNALSGNPNNLNEKPLEPIVESSVMIRRDASINCDFCTSTFPSVAYLEQHMAVHMNEKTFTCQLCPVRFANHEDLANHMKVHGTENEHLNSFTNAEMKCPQISDKYICALCKEHFVNLGSLKRHQAKGHCTPTIHDGM